jgi:glycosyltransferase involved in cell wall biosynthesis
MRVAITTVQIPFVSGGAEMHAAGLAEAIRAAGHEAEIVTVPFKWYPPDNIAQQVLACRLLDLSESMGTRIDRVIGLKFPAYLIRHPDKVLWILHQHRSAYDLWEHQWGDLYGQPGGDAAMAVIRSADSRLIPEARRIYANSRNVAARLRRFCGIDSEPLYHPPPLAGPFRSGEAGDYFLMPSRVNGPKRQDLVVRAMLLTRQPVRVIFIGAADNPAYLSQVQIRAAGLPPGRATWLGGVSDERKIALMAEALGVLVPAFDEDYGYVTLEAMLASRPVITCSDSGGPLEFIEHGRNGLICDPTPAALAAAMDALWAGRAQARAMGNEGRARYTEIGLSWEHVVECLLS